MAHSVIRIVFLNFHILEFMFLFTENLSCLDQLG